MATQVQWRGGSELEHSTFTGAPKEVTVDTTRKTIRVHDGSTVGGFPLARQDELDSQLSGIKTDFYGPTDPSLVVANGIVAGMVWADTASLTVKRRNSTNDDWVVESKLFQSHIPEYSVSPVSDIGPIYLTGEGPAEWSATAGTYVAIGGGAKGGGADKIFYLNDRVITEDYTVVSGQNAGSTGPIEVLLGVTVQVEPGAVWKVS